MAQEEKKSGTESEYVTSTGITIKLKQVDPIFLQSVANSVKPPRAPTYEAKTISGRTEVHRLDAVAAKQIENGESLWQAYQDDLAAATTDQADRIMRALFYMGTECEIPEGWEKKYGFLGISVPTDPDERRVFYLSSELPIKDVVGITSAISKLTGINEDAIRQAEDAFRDILSK